MSLAKFDARRVTEDNGGVDTQLKMTKRLGLLPVDSGYLVDGAAGGC